MRKSREISGSLAVRAGSAGGEGTEEAGMLIENRNGKLNAGVMLNEVSFANFPIIMRQAGMD